MTNQELIELLQQEDPSKQVCKHDSDGNLVEVETVVVIRITRLHDSNGDIYVVVID